MVQWRLRDILRTSTAQKRAAGFLGGWTAGEGLRRPVPLMDEQEATSSSRRRRCGLDGGDDDGDDGGGAPGAAEETAEERWIRERDDWLFGRSVRHSVAGTEI